MKHKNVIFFIVDSVRHYTTESKDDRDKLEMMDRFEKESVYFPLTVTSAPSSIMSLSSMLTSLPSYYIARNYDDFKYDSNQFISLHNILKQNGYDARSLFNARELRFLFGDVIKHVDEKFWPKGTNTNQKNWSNATMNQILKKFLDSKTLDEPFFFLAWYNIRLDPNTSDLIEEAINMIKENNLWDDSIFILGSDHGYMDPKRGFTPENLKARGLSHDLLMTDDNIRIPFYLKYPGSPVKKIENQVSTLDFLPTVLSLLDIEYPESPTYTMKGMDLTKLINEEPGTMELFDKRQVRCDARFFAQADRSTALRDRHYKYVTRPDKNIEEFYYITEDEWEENNLIDKPEYTDIINTFRESYNESEKEIMEFQLKYLLSKLPVSLRGNGQKRKIVILGQGESYYLDQLTKVFKEFWGSSAILHLISSQETTNKMENVSEYDEVFSLSLNDENSVRSKLNSLPKYDQLITLTDTRNKVGVLKFENVVLPLIKYKKKIDLDANMEFTARDKSLLHPKLIFRVLWQKKDYYLKNPKMIFNHFIKWFRIVLKID
jgi:hypothetical protein